MFSTHGTHEGVYLVKAHLSNIIKWDTKWNQHIRAQSQFIVDYILPFLGRIWCYSEHFLHHNVIIWISFIHFFGCFTANQARINQPCLLIRGGYPPNIHSSIAFKRKVDLVYTALTTQRSHDLEPGDPRSEKYCSWKKNAFASHS